MTPSTWRRPTNGEFYCTWTPSPTLAEATKACDRCRSCLLHWVATVWLMWSAFWKTEAGFAWHPGNGYRWTWKRCAIALSRSKMFISGFMEIWMKTKCGKPFHFRLKILFSCGPWSPQTTITHSLKLYTVMTNGLTAIQKPIRSVQTRADRFQWAFRSALPDFGFVFDNRRACTRTFSRMRFQATFIRAVSNPNNTEFIRKLCLMEGTEAASRQHPAWLRCIAVWLHYWSQAITFLPRARYSDQRIRY